MISTLIHKSVNLDSESMKKKYIYKTWPQSTGTDVFADDVYNVFKGVVVFVGLGTDNKYVITVQIDATQIIRYGNLLEEYVSPNQSILDGIKIGRADKYVHVEYCTTSIQTFSGSNIVRLGQTTYYKVDPYDVVSGTKKISVNGVSAYDQSLTGNKFDYTQFLNADAITPYIATLSPYVSPKDVNYPKMKSNDIVGVMLYGGSLFDSTHSKRKYYRSDNIRNHVELAEKNDISFGIYVDVYARNKEEAKEECRQLYYLISKYPPSLGLWLKLHLVKSKTINDSILYVYQEQTDKWGLRGRCGIYADKNQISNISWDKHQEYFLLWLISYSNRLESKDTLLTPSYFKL